MLNRKPLAAEYLATVDSLYSEDSFSEEEEESEADAVDPRVGPLTETGCVSKWTNMLHGWQERYLVLKDGILTYYKSELEVDRGCRGAIRLRKAQVQPHPYDDCRIDVS